MMLLRTTLALLTAASTAANPVSTGGSSMSDDAGLGSSMLHTHGNRTPQPLTAQEAGEQGWTRTSTSCDPALGWEYQPAGGVRAKSPLSAYYTGHGQLCGLKMTIFHLEGPPAGAWPMITDGYYTPVSRGDDETTEPAEFEMSVSFRGVEDVCADAALPDAIGDRVVINQHAIAVSVPMTLGEADADDWQPSSCMKGMGQHYFKDLTTGSDMSFVTGNLLPIAPMYYPPNDPDAKLNAFLFSWPGCQHGEGHNWDNVPVFCALTNAMMCQNFCNENCSMSHFSDYSFHDPVAERYGTYHVFFIEDEDWGSLTCPGAPEWITGRTCPANTGTPDLERDESSPQMSVRRNV